MSCRLRGSSARRSASIPVADVLIVFAIEDAGSFWHIAKVRWL
jgi:hypothetical protein